MPQAATSYEHQMSTVVAVDETDKKILQILIADARAGLKDIAQQCGISSVSVLNRIKRLKKSGVIIGATLFPNIGVLGFQIIATIGMETDGNIDEILKFFREHTYLIEPSPAFGEYDLCAVVYAENMASLSERIETVRRRFGIRKVIVNAWSGLPHSNFEKLDLTPFEKS